MEFSRKQRKVLTWWCDGSEERDLDAIICDGAVRSGKTFAMGLSFFCWAMRRFDGRQFALCARTAEACRRNLLHQVIPALEEAGFRFHAQTARSRLTVTYGGHTNVFYLFGGENEASAARIQGVTLAGALLDEAALMPRSFVEQTVARCSAEGAKVWFSCNPEGPEHWFYREWILKAEEKRALRLRFLMSDNPSLSQATLERYERSFQGACYQRFILGEWVAERGRVYDFFDDRMVRDAPEGGFQEWRVSCDYGTASPTSMGLWGRQGDTWYRVEEFYYDPVREGRQKTDWEYAQDLERLCAGRRPRRVVVDPSAASFLAALREEGWPAEAADNDVLSGIRRTADLLRRGRIVICRPCRNAIREFSLYRWDDKSSGDRVVKRFDHAMDEIRYFAATVAGGERFIGGWSVRRNSG